MYTLLCDNIFCIRLYFHLGIKSSKDKIFKEIQHTNVQFVKQVIHKVSFENHTYLLYDDGYIGGFCHDENCKCKELK